MIMPDVSFLVGDVRLTVTATAWQETPVEALVLSANNQLSLRPATGHAGWLGAQCSHLHDECQRLVRSREHQPWRGIPPGEGMVTENGPAGKMIIHAVSVDYGGHFRPGEGRCYAGIDTVAAATVFALKTAIWHQVHSVAFAPMCTRGHADACLPDWMATEVLPRVQAEIIFGLAAVRGELHSLREVVFSAHNEDPDRTAFHFRIIEETWANLYRRLCDRSQIT
jgi:O-acetyl-ADP-ribose deacetylase (regulator of RNase III)